MTGTDEAAQAVFDERYFAVLARGCELTRRAKEAARDDAIHAELRRTMEELADMEREMRVREQFRLLRQAI